MLKDKSHEIGNILLVLFSLSVVHVFAFSVLIKAFVIRMIGRVDRNVV